MLARLALPVLSILTAAAPVTAATALPDRFLPSAKLDCALRQSSATISDIVILNRSAVAVPAQTYIEVRSDAGGTVTVVAPNGIRFGGHLNVRQAKIAGETCTATIVLVNAP